MWKLYKFRFDLLQLGSIIRDVDLPVNFAHDLDLLVLMPLAVLLSEHNQV